MALKISRTVLLKTLNGTIKVVPQGGRKVRLTMPDSVKVTDRNGKPLAGK